MSVRDVVQAAAGALGGDKLYVEDVFSTYLYTGNGSTQTITNGVDLSGEGGLVWIKSRSVRDHVLFDTERGTLALESNTTDAQQANRGLTGYTSTGFSLNDPVAGDTNATNTPFASWTFRKAPKFFDIVTYTGNGSGPPATQTIAHNLGSTPGCIIVKMTSGAENWAVFHRTQTNSARLNQTGAFTQAQYFDPSGINDTHFKVKGDYAVNQSGQTYVAYLFAHDAGGFGDDGLQNVISCGSYTGNGSVTGPVIDLGYEPQWLMIKDTTTSNWSWYIVDNMRGFGETQYSWLAANETTAETVLTQRIRPLATGFQPVSTLSPYNASGSTYIYIAIRRGPMKVPESGTSVFSPTFTSSATGTTLTTGFPVDMQILGGTTVTGNDKYSINDRLRKVSSTTTEAQLALCTSDTRAEFAGSNNQTRLWNNTGFQMPSYWGGLPTIFYNFGRAPGFFDVVAYTGNGTAGRTVAHNLGVAPELIIVKARNDSRDWVVSDPANGWTNWLRLNQTLATGAVVTIWNNTAPTDSVFSLGASAYTNGSPTNFIAYLFATLAGVSKVGSYTGTAADLNVDCGFSAGARFVLIKRTDSAGDWYLWDSARGIVAGNDPYLLLNSTAAQNTSTDYIDPYSAGFTVTSSAPAALNASGGTYIFLAIA